MVGFFVSTVRQFNTASRTADTPTHHTADEAEIGDLSDAKQKHHRRHAKTAETAADAKHGTHTDKRTTDHRRKIKRCTRSD